MTGARVAGIPELSIVVPCYNEQENAAGIAAAIVAVMEDIGISFEIVFIDNASLDDTVAIIKGLCAGDARIRLIVNTRNFGQMRSPVHAVYATRGDAVVGIAADFQDPPELLKQFVERWRCGADIVLGVRQSEKTSTLLAWMRSISYWFAEKFGDYPVVPNATGFGLYDRKVVNAIQGLREPEPFWRGLAVETGFRVDTVFYERPVRTRGHSSNDFFALLDFALSALSSFSKKMVRVPFYIGVVIGACAAASLLAALAGAIFGGPVVSWLIAAAIEVQFGLLFVFLGVIGDQVRLISERTRETPLVFERERVNFPDDH